MSRAYDTFETLRQQNAVLRETVALNSGIQLAARYNKHDTITVKSNHHTLSLYVADGYESYQKRRAAGKTAAAGPFLSDAKEVNRRGIFAMTCRLSISTAPMSICVMSGKNLGQAPAVPDAG